MYQSAGTCWPPTSLNIHYRKNGHVTKFYISLTHPWTSSRHFSNIAYRYCQPGRNFEHYFRGPGIDSFQAYATWRQHSRRQTPVTIGHFQQKNLEKATTNQGKKKMREINCSNQPWIVSSDPSAMAPKVSTWGDGMDARYMMTRRNSTSPFHNTSSTSIGRKSEERKLKPHKMPNLVCNYSCWYNANHKFLLVARCVDLPSPEPEISWSTLSKRSIIRAHIVWMFCVNAVFTIDMSPSIFNWYSLVLFLTRSTNVCI